MIRAVICGAFVLFSQPIVATPQRPAAMATAQVGGAVTSPVDSGEQPIRRAQVSLMKEGTRFRETVTDDRGRFLFTDLPAGRYTINARRDGYLFTSFGQKSSAVQTSGTPVVLADGQRELGLKISMLKGSVISGVITDLQGQPLPDLGVEVFFRSIVGGVVTLTRSGTDLTDDQGAYRVFGLRPGAYVVSVGGGTQLGTGVPQTSAADVQWALQPGSRAAPALMLPPVRRTAAMAPSYYPGTVDIQSAGTVTVEPGRERSGVNFVVQVIPMSRVSGTLTRPDGTPVPSGLSVSLDLETPAGFDAGSTGLANRVRPRTMVGAGGAFEFSAVAPGNYAMTALLGAEAGSAWLKSPVSVGGQDMTGLAFALRPTGEIHGRVVAEGSAALPDLSKATVNIASTATPGSSLVSSLRASPGADGVFTIRGVVPGSYRLEIFIPGEDPVTRSPLWTPKAASVAGRDATDRYFDIPSGGDIEAVITLTDRIASLTGKLIDRQNTPATDFFVLLIPVDRSKWLPRLRTAPRSTRPASDGTFRFGTVSPGEYYVAASTDFDVREILNTEYIEQFIAAAIKLTIAEGEKKVQDLKIGG